MHQSSGLCLAGTEETLSWPYGDDTERREVDRANGRRANRSDGHHSAFPGFMTLWDRETASSDWASTCFSPCSCPCKEHTSSSLPRDDLSALLALGQPLSPSALTGGHLNQLADCHRRKVPSPRAYEETRSLVVVEERGVIQPGTETRKWIMGDISE